MATKTPPRQIIKVIQNPDSWDPLMFETAMRNDVENSTGPLCASDELLISMLVMTMETLIMAQIKVKEEGPVYMYNSGESPSAWIKIRTECLDKVIKIMTELSLVTRFRAKSAAKPTSVDELFATA